MKTMKCSQLGGACEKEFSAETFEEIAAMSKQHGVEMYEKGDAPHLEAMERMRALMSDSEAMNKWYEEKRKEFELL